MKIKKLEWLDEEGDTLVALGFFGCFQITPSWHGEFTASLNESNGHDAFEDENFKTIEEAQEYCQHFLEKQVEGALKFVDWSGAKSLKEWADFTGYYMTIQDNGVGLATKHAPSIIQEHDDVGWAPTAEDYSNYMYFTLDENMIAHTGAWDESLTVPAGLKETC